jgi:hypothetical protein
MAFNSQGQMYQARQGTKFKVEFPGFKKFSQRPYEIELRQHSGSHDILTLKYLKFGPVFNKGLKTKVLVHVEWHNGNNIKGHFYGVVSSVSRAKAAQLDQELEVVCVGNSFDMKDSSTGTWTNKTIPEVVAIFAKKHNFKSEITPSSARYSQLSQHGESDWVFLNNLAEKNGYCLWVKNKTLFFKTIDDVIDGCEGSKPILYFENYMIPAYSAAVERTLDRFEPITGDFLEMPGLTKNSLKTVAGVDPLTVKAYTTTTSPNAKSKTRKDIPKVWFEDLATHHVVNSKEFSKEVAQAVAAKARWVHPAKFFGQGDPRISPYQLLEIRGVDSSNDGDWLVQSVTHTMRMNGTYSVTGTVLSEGKGSTKTTNVRRKNAYSVPVLNLNNFKEGKMMGTAATCSASAPMSPEFSSTTAYTIAPQEWR